MTQLMIVIQRGRVGLFVRRNNVETFTQEVGVLIGNRLAGGTIDNHRIQQVILFNQTNQTPQIQLLFRFGKLRTPVFEVQPMHIGQQGL